MTHNTLKVFSKAQNGYIVVSTFYKFNVITKIKYILHDSNTKFVCSSENLNTLLKQAEK